MTLLLSFMLLVDTGSGNLPPNGAFCGTGHELVARQSNVCGQLVGLGHLFKPVVHGMPGQINFNWTWEGVELVENPGLGLYSHGGCRCVSHVPLAFDCASWLTK